MQSKWWCVRGLYVFLWGRQQAFHTPLCRATVTLRLLAIPSSRLWVHQDRTALPRHGTWLLWAMKWERKWWRKLYKNQLCAFLSLLGWPTIVLTGWPTTLDPGENSMRQTEGTELGWTHTVWKTLIIICLWDVLPSIMYPLTCAVNFWVEVG